MVTQWLYLNICTFTITNHVLLNMILNDSNEEIELSVNNNSIKVKELFKLSCDTFRYLFNWKFHIN